MRQVKHHLQPSPTHTHTLPVHIFHAPMVLHWSPAVLKRFHSHQHYSREFKKQIRFNVANVVNLLTNSSVLKSSPAPTGGRAAANIDGSRCVELFRASSRSLKRVSKHLIAQKKEKAGVMSSNANICCLCLVSNFSSYYFFLYI